MLLGFNFKLPTTLCDTAIAFSSIIVLTLLNAGTHDVHYYLLSTYIINIYEHFL